MKMSSEGLINCALKYLDNGFSVITVNGKKPAIESWKQYQDRRPTGEEMIKMFANKNVSGVAIITGEISGVVVLDVEANQDMSSFDIPSTLTVQSGGGGKHFYFRYPKDKNVASLNLRSSLKIEADLKSDGGYVVAPPSSHPSGDNYVWLNELELADLPQWLIKINESATKKESFKEIIKGVPEGSRHNSATRIVGKLLHHLPEKDWNEVAVPLIDSWNKTNTPPLGDKELGEIFEWATKKHSEKVEPLDLSQKILSVRELLNLPEQKSLFIVDKLIPENGITVLSGHPGSSKTWIELAIATAVANGEPLFGKFETQKGSVLIVDEESGEMEYQRRIKLLKISEDIEIYLASQFGVKLDNDESKKYLLSIIKENDIKLLILDPWISFHSKEENSSSEMQKVLGVLTEINRLGCSVMFIHHHKKDGIKKSSPGQALRGSSAFDGRVDSHIAIEKVEEENGVIEIEVIQAKLRRGKKAEPFTLELIESETGEISFNFKDGIDETKKKKETAKEIIIGLLNMEGEMSKEQIQEILLEQSVGGRNTGEALKELVTEDKIHRKKIGKKHFYFTPDEVEAKLELKEED